MILNFRQLDNGTNGPYVDKVTLLTTFPNVNSFQLNPVYQ